MILADLTLNLAAGLTQWLLEPQLDSWRRRISDPQRKAVEEVIQRSARRMLIQMEADLKRDRPDLGPGDFQALGEMLCDYFALPQAARALLEAAILGRPLDNERMHTHFRTVHGPERLTGIPFVLEGCLSLFLQHLGEEISRSAQDVESPLYNFWSVLVQADIHVTAGQTLSEVQDIRLLLQQAPAPDAPTQADMVAYLAGVCHQYSRWADEPDGGDIFLETRALPMRLAQYVPQRIEGGGQSVELLAAVQGALQRRSEPPREAPSQPTEAG